MKEFTPRFVASPDALHVHYHDTGIPPLLLLTSGLTLTVSSQPGKKDQVTYRLTDILAWYEQEAKADLAEGKTTPAKYRHNYAALMSYQEAFVAGRINVKS